VSATPLVFLLNSTKAFTIEPSLRSVIFRF
jgi:hypothetical protein